MTSVLSENVVSGHPGGQGARSQLVQPTHSRNVTSDYRKNETHLSNAHDISAGGATKEQEQSLREHETFERAGAGVAAPADCRDRTAQSLIRIRYIMEHFIIAAV